MKHRGQARSTVPGAMKSRAVTSLQNDRVKFIRSLEMRKARRDTGLFVAEGASILVSAREHGYVPETLVMLSGGAERGIARGLVEWALGRRNAGRRYDRL